MNASIVFLLSLVASVIYIVVGIKIIRAMKGAGSKAQAWLRWPITAALVMQGIALNARFFICSDVTLGVGFILAEIFFVASLILLLESWVHRLHGQFGIVLLVAGIAALAPFVFKGEPIPSSIAWSTLFRWHLLLAISAYAFFMIALVHAVLLTLQNRQLRHPTLENTEESFLDSLPGLVVMERIFFRILTVGFLFLTATVVLGAWTTHDTLGVWIHWDHKTLLTWAAWVLFAILLVGRYAYGWRAGRALLWFWFSFGTFAVAYLGYALVRYAFMAI